MKSQIFWAGIANIAQGAAGKGSLPRARLVELR